VSASIIPIRTVTARRVDFDWPFRRERSGEIAAHWQATKAEKPAMFNGQVLLQCRGELSGDSFSADYFELDYASFIAWHRWGYPQQGSAQIRNGFAMGALRSRDGAYVMGVMANHTVNAGRIYFAAGTPDPGDVLANGTVDLAGSVIRELEEETGLLPSEVSVGEGWRVILSDERVAYMRDLVIDLPGEEARTLIRDRLSRQSEPELADIVLARSAADIDEARMPLFMQVFLRDVFKTR
jgi:8-oxo-dGTP pyrophosphatase MutT (NUDIX family)